MNMRFIYIVYSCYLFFLITVYFIVWMYQYIMDM